MATMTTTTTTTTANTMEEFKAGVTACLRSWSALRTAVESGWGGGERESQAKADQLRQSIFEIMNGSQYPIPNFDEQDLADNLAIYLEEEFSVTLEDDSERQVAETIFRMYENCGKGDTTLARQMVAHADQVVAFNAQFPVHVQSTEHDDDDDDEDMSDTPQTAAGTLADQNAKVAAMHIPSDYSDKPLFGEDKKIVVNTGPVRQLGEKLESVEEVEMDEDGFAPVKPKSRKNR